MSGVEKAALRGGVDNEGKIHVQMVFDDTKPATVAKLYPPFSHMAIRTNMLDAVVASLALVAAAITSKVSKEQGVPADQQVLVDAVVEKSWQQLRHAIEAEGIDDQLETDTSATLDDELSRGDN